MGKALYRKYRSKSLSEVVGQEHITRTLENSLKSGSISHAYLFTGPHGVGKTSIARILAHEVNQFPYDEATTHVDIIEIDAASNRRIDEMRDLRDRVSIAPVAGKYKVYIIDEVHMLTREAFNALLKTLEEPPEHVIFILATTEAHKLPETIISRTQRHSFRPIDHAAVVGHLKSIAKSEKIAIDDEALSIIAEHGHGSFRDSISLLDQVSQSKSTVTADDVRALLGVPPDTAINDLIATLGQKPADIISEIAGLQARGYSGKIIAQATAKHLREQLIANDSELSSQDIISALQTLLEVESSPDPFARLELVLLDLHFAQSHQTDHKPAASKTQDAAVHNPSLKIPAKRKIVAAVTEQTPSPATEANTEPHTTASISTDFDWSACLDTVKQRYNTLYGILRMATTETTDQGLVLTFQYGFHQKKINDQKNKTIIADIIHAQCGQTLTIITRVDTTQKTPVANAVGSPTPKPAKAEPADAPNPAIDAISNIFGGAEVLE